MNRRSCWLVIIATGLELVLAGCASNDASRHIGVLLDPIGEAADNYGTVSASSPMLTDAEVLRDQKGFEFDLKKSGPDEYYEAARRESNGGVGIFSQRANDLRIGVQGRFNLENLLKNSILLNQFDEDTARFKRSQSLRDSGELLKLLVPLIDPNLKFEQMALAAGGAAGDAAGTGGQGGADASAGESTGSDADKKQLTPDEERVARLKSLFAALGANQLGPTSRPALPQFENAPPAVDPAVLPTSKELRDELLNNSKFEKFQSLMSQFAASQPVVAPRSAIITAAGDNMVEAIMRYLGQPVPPGDWKDKKVLMGVSMVSVAPGTRTMRGYVAQVSVSCRIGYAPARRELIEAMLKDKEARGHVLNLLNFVTGQDVQTAWTARQEASKKYQTLKAGNNDPEKALAALDQANAQWSKILNETRNEGKIATSAMYGQQFEDVFDLQSHDGHSRLVRALANNTQPVVAAASPMTEAQTLDLASSIRSQQSFALKLALVVSGFGADAQVQALDQFFKRLEQDAVTKTPLNTVAAFSNTNSVFGYQVGPSLQGAADFIPTRREGGLIGILRSLIIGDIEPGPDMVLQRQSFPVMLFIGLNSGDLDIKLLRVGDQDGGQFCLAEPRIEFRQTTRWIPMRHSRTGNINEPRPRIRESERVGWAANLDSAAKQAAAEKNSSPILSSYVENRVQILTSEMLEAASSQALPIGWFLNDFNGQRDMTVAPEIQDILPKAITIEATDPKTPTTSTTSLIALLGRHLEGLVDVAVVADDPNVITATLGGPSAPVGQAMTARLVKVEIKLKDADNRSPIEFRLKCGYKAADDQSYYVLTPPISIRPPVAPKEPKKEPSPPATQAADLKRESKWQMKPASQPATVDTTHTDSIWFGPRVPNSIVREFVRPTPVPTSQNSVDLDLEISTTAKQGSGKN